MRKTDLELRPDRVYGIPYPETPQMGNARISLGTFTDDFIVREISI